MRTTSPQCACHIEYRQHDDCDRIRYCPTHAQAFAALDFIRRYVAASSNIGPYPKEARAILRAVEG